MGGFRGMLLLIIASLGRTALSEKPFLTAPNSDLDAFHTFTSPDSSSYTTLTLEKETQILYIGARNTVFGRKSDDITKEAFSPVFWPVQKNSGCETLPQSKNGRKCYSQIQIVQPLNGTHVLVCGTNSLTPQNKYLVKNAKNQYSMVEDSDHLKDPLCSFDPADPVTSLVVRSHDGPHIFSTTRPEFASKIYLVKTMPQGLLISQDEMKGDKSTFVSSFTAEDDGMPKVYVVSDEKTGETNMPGPSPTITQVCANDIGGQNLLANSWTSLLKVRLSCQTADIYPLKFDLVTDLVPGREGIIYGTFATRHETSRTNAVCAFRLEDVQKAFGSNVFWDTQSKQHKKVSGPQATPRPGTCASAGSSSQSLSSSLLRFMSSHNLIADVVTPAYPPSGSGTTPAASNRPLLIKPEGKFSKIAVEQVTGIDGVVYDVLFVGKDNGQILKFISIVKGKSVETIELAQYQPTSLPIVSMTVSRELGQLYIGTNHSVHQLSTSNCAAYTSSCKFCDPCRMCVLSRDPGCAWDKSAKRCVTVRNRSGSDSLLQDVSNGNAQMLCGHYKTSSTELVKVNDGQSQVLGHIITNHAVSVTWHKVKDSSTTEISKKVGKFYITSDGQLEIKNFNATQDAAVYEARYKARDSMLNVFLYNVQSTAFVLVIPTTTASPTTTAAAPVTNPVDTTKVMTPGTTGEPATTTFIAIGGAPYLPILIGVILLVALILAIAVFLLCRKRRRKSLAGNEKYSMSLENGTPPTEKHNATSNNNSQLARVQSEYDDRANRPLLNLSQDRSDCDVESNHLELPTSSQRNTKSLDNILDGHDLLDYIDDDTASDKGPARQHSMRDHSTRQRKPPVRTKSMPGSALYVVYAGKKLMCSSLQRNRQGTWTIKLQPNQSGMSDMSSEHDEIIDILNDGPAEGSGATFLPSPNHRRGDSLDITNPKGIDMKAARESFFKDDINKKPGGPSDGVVQFATSTPNSSGSVVNKPKIAPKPSHLLPNSPKRTLKKRKSVEASFGHNSSEDHDSDSTVKGSNATLKPDETPPSAGAPHKHRHHNHHRNHDNGAQRVSTEVHTPDVPVLTATPNKKGRNKPLISPGGTKRFSSERSSGSSDGDENLHGCHKDVKRKNRNVPQDSQSKQSRTSQGSSTSSGDYRSARSSVISSEPSQDQR